MKRCDLDRELKRYYRAIGKALVCPGPLRRQTVERIRSGVEEYLEAHPGAEWAEITEHFGTPEKIADEVLSAMEPGEVRRYAKRTRVLRIAIIALLVGALIWYAGGWLLRAAYTAQEAVIITIGPGTEVDSMPPKPTD